MSIFKRMFGGSAAAPKTKREKRAYFKGAQVSRLLLDWITAPLAADKEIRSDMRALRSRARDLARNNPFIRQYLALVTTNVIGPHGIRMQAQVTDSKGELAKTVNTLIEQAWLKWCRRATVDGRMSMTQAMQLAARTLPTDGEVFIKMVVEEDDDGKFFFALQLIDADLVDHEYNQPAGVNRNEIRLGVEIDRFQRPVALHVWDRHQADENQSARERIRVPAKQLIHMFDPERISQTRGTTWFNSVMVSLTMFDGYVEAELTAARTAAAKMGWLKYTDAAALQLEGEIPTAPLQYDASPGTIEMLPPGVEFQEWNPSHPTTAFDSYSKGIIRQVASGLRVSYNALANDLSDVNYSSFRSGILIEREVWRTLQQLFIERVYQPVFEAWLEVALLNGDLKLGSPDPSRYSNAIRWIPRGWQWVDPLKDIQAGIAAIENGLASRSDILAESGMDFEETLENLVREKRMAEEAGLIFGAGANALALAAQQAGGNAADSTDETTTS